MSPTTWSPIAWDRRLVAPGPAARLLALHCGLLAVIGVRLTLRRWWVMADRPAELFEPVPFLGWLDGPPGAAAILVVWALGLCAVGWGLWAVVRGEAPGTALRIAWSALVVLTGLWGSAGKVLHNDVLLLTVCVPLLLAPAARRGDRSSVRWGWPPRAVLAVLATVYFLTGYQKLRHSGIDWVLSSNMSWVIRQGDPVVPERLARSLADQLWLTQALAGGALVVELLAPVLLALRRTRIWFALAATAMHGSIWVLLGLDYYGWVLTVWAVVLPFTPLGDRVWRWLQPDGAAAAAEPAEVAT